MSRQFQIGTEEVGVDVTLITCPMSGEASYTKIVREATTHNPISENVWGATLYVIIKDFPDIALGEFHVESIFRAAFVMICYILNLMLQMLMVFWVGTGVALPAVYRLQNLYRTFHATSYVDGIFDEDAFRENMADGREDLCQIALSTRAFLIAILFLWVASCSAEFKEIIRRITEIRALPALPPGMGPHDMVHETEQGEGHWHERLNLLVCLNRWTTFWIYALILIPRLLVASVLCVAGCIWLMAAENFSDLILNSLALKFIVDIDELIYSVFLPARLGQTLSNTKVALAVDTSLTKEAREHKDIVNAYLRSCGYLLGSIGFVAAIMYFEPIVPSYRWDVRGACADYLANEETPWCLPWHTDCFPLGR
eukprot:TRINITY_DN30023_c0_g1_i1.p1 TRINITY_DN30023_c0_g1~~TRINITY_DN30023_c0_g1_i1.p1  ORF type:complete len:369 (+),score=37.06 TRINITY_DN30023_c0_g1_i1:43-1149(+)